MTPGQAREAVSHLVDAYPTASLSADTLAVYARSLSDFTVQEAWRAINAWTSTERFFPSVSDLRHLVVEERLQLPSPEEAWEAVGRRLAWSPSAYETCVECAGFGTRLHQPGDDRRSEAEIACPKCRGVGRFPLGKPPALDDVTKRALDFVGGPWAVRNAAEPGIVRGQFLKAHARFRQEEIRTANLVSLGVLEPAARRQAELESA